MLKNRQVQRWRAQGVSCGVVALDLLFHTDRPLVNFAVNGRAQFASAGAAPSRRMVKMNKRLVFLFVATVANSVAAFAGCGDPGTYLTAGQLAAILSNNYACGRSVTDPPGWNEQHVGVPGGLLLEMHEGGATVENVGSWSVSGDVIGTVTYSYTGAPPAAYEVAFDSVPCPDLGCLPATYQFCPVAPGPLGPPLRIYVSTTFQAPSAVGVMNGNCPLNPPPG